MALLSAGQTLQTEVESPPKIFNLIGSTLLSGGRAAWSVVRRLEARPGVAATTLAAGFGLLFGWLQHYPTFPDPDAFYHAKMAVLFLHGTLVRTFPWLPLTILGSHFADLHFLYHVALIPFVSWLDPLVGVKVAAAVFGVAVVLVYYLVLRRLGVPAAFWLTVLVFTTASFLLRLSLVKALPLSLGLYLLGLVCLKERRPWALFAVSWLYVWTYAGWPLLLVTVIIYAVISLVTSSTLTTGARTLLAAAVAGTVAGIAVNPYFPHNLWVYWYQIVRIALSPVATFGAGGEWLPFSFKDLYLAAAPLFIGALAVGSLAELVWITSKHTPLLDPHDRPYHLALGTVTVGVFLMTAFSRRYIEYLVPIAYLTLGLFGASLWRSADFSALVWAGGPETGRLASWRRAALGSSLALALLIYIGWSLVAVNGQMRPGLNMTYLQAVSEWMKTHLPPQTLVFNTRWDLFPLLFYWDGQQRYASGLDVRFLRDDDQQRLIAWQDLYRGQASDPAHLVRQTFASSYALAVTSQDSANKLFSDRGWAVLYRDREAVLYAVP